MPNSMQTKQRWCPNEQRAVLAQHRTPNHILHLLLALVTGGMWLIVWLAVCIGLDRRWRCPSCGTVTLARKPWHPSDKTAPPMRVVTKGWWVMREEAVPMEELRWMNEHPPVTARNGWVLVGQVLVAVGIVMWLAVRLIG